MCDVLSGMFHPLLNILEHPKVFLTLLSRSVSDTSLDVYDRKYHKKKWCVAATHPSGRGRAIEFRSRMQGGGGIVRAHDEGGDLGEDRLGGAGGGHTAGA
jgi:hypothetical protein